MFPTDFFDFFRLALGTVATIYATIVTVQSLWNWYVWLAGTDKYISLVRRYVIVHGLRLRIRAFWGDVVVSVLLCVVFVIIMRAHWVIEKTSQRLSEARLVKETNVGRHDQHH